MAVITITSVQRYINKFIDSYTKQIDSENKHELIKFRNILINIRDDLNSAKNNILNMI